MFKTTYVHIVFRHYITIMRQITLPIEICEHSGTEPGVNIIKRINCKGIHIQ